MNETTSTWLKPPEELKNLSIEELVAAIEKTELEVVESRSTNPAEVEDHRDVLHSLYAERLRREEIEWRERLRRGDA